jgi:ABC-type branched-subunit amino acid transport system substrate-binding protein
VSFINKTCRATAAFALSLIAFGAHAQIVIGQTAGFTGTVAAGVKETADGAHLYIDAINAHGGVNGQKIELISMDDGFEPKRAAENARRLITERGAVALFLNRGTPHTEAIKPLLEEFKVPLIAPSTGAMSLHSPVNHYIFNVRATYQREAEKAVRHLATIGMTRIAVLQVDDSFGADGALGATRGLEAVNLKPVVFEKFDRSKPDFAPIAPKVAAAQAQAVIILGSGNAVVDAIRALRAAGSFAQAVTLSNNASAGFVKSLGEFGRGTIVTQVFPYERSLAAPIVKEAHDLLVAKNAGAEITPLMVEGYAAAKVLVEALRRAGPSPTSAKILTALEGMKRVDIGGLEVTYGPNDHTGLDFADLAIIGPDGKFKR